MSGLAFQKKLADGATYMVLSLVSLIILLPLLWVLRTSLLPEVKAYQIPPDFTTSPTITNYLELFREKNFSRFLINSFIVSTGTTILALPIATLGGFSFTRYKTGGRALQFGILGTQMLPAIVLILPIFVIFRTAGLTDSYLGLILAYLSYNLPFLVWILMGFFEGIPPELEEAAALDGLSPSGTFVRIVVPTATPGIMAAAVLSFILAWNEFLLTLVLAGIDTTTVPVRLAAMQTKQGILISQLSAGTVLAISPMVVIAVFVRKYLISGLTLGAVK